MSNVDTDRFCYLHPQVFYLDYGNMAHVPVSRLKEMSPRHMELPFQVFTDSGQYAVVNTVIL